ncbi:hypothetical protein AB0D37_35210 [Streptomyces sp. NPDC048384]|uniref:hypothetical protein n=1 Tax=Streptomyces sp. NPDC048384 TaxID=3155487 RepID=UPI003429DC6F
MPVPCLAWRSRPVLTAVAHGPNPQDETRHQGEQDRLDELDDPRTSEPYDLVLGVGTSAYEQDVELPALKSSPMTYSTSTGRGQKDTVHPSRRASASVYDTP